MRVLIVGVPDPTHVGGHFLQASRTLGLEATLLPVGDAYRAPRLIRSLCWHLMGRRPPRLQKYSNELLSQCRKLKPDLVLTTGLAPVSAKTLGSLAAQKIKVANFLTDDPWNKAHDSPWFMRGLRLYQHVFTPRHANEAQLSALLGPEVSYLPFAYAPEAHFPPPAPECPALAQRSSTVLFIGGADLERDAVMNALQQRGFDLSLWGSYWDRRPSLKAFAHGHADLETFRYQVASNALNLCLVRKANRDGHSMRSFEIPAVGGCMVVEDTEEHRTMFGPDGQCVRYFANMDELEQQARSLLGNPIERQRLAEAAHHRICREGHHTYADRLQTIIQEIDS